MTRPNDLVRDAVELLIAHGFTPAINDRGKHPKIRWVDDGGRHCVLVVSRSPSDRRARAKSRAILRRLLRNSEESPQC